LVGSDGLLEGVTAVTVTAGQVVSSVHLRALIPNGLISDYLWNDYCLTGENGQPMAGNCVRDDNGFYHADGMIQPTESYIAGVAISLRPDSCTSNSGGTVEFVTDSDGRYTVAVTFITLCSWFSPVSCAFRDNYSLPLEVELVETGRAGFLAGN
jgi:hypothetical protein